MAVKRKPGSVYFVTPPGLKVIDCASMCEPDFKSQVVQSAKDECDINKIVETFTKTGQLPTAPPPQFADASFMAMTLEQRVNLVRAIPDIHASLPASIKKLAPKPADLLNLSLEQITKAFESLPAKPAESSPASPPVAEDKTPPPPPFNPRHFGDPPVESPPSPKPKA